MSDLREQYGQPQSEWPLRETADNQIAVPLQPLKNIAPDASSALIKLGEKLFNDKRLSRDKTVSCATCHENRLGFTDRRKVAIGIDGLAGTRNTQAIFGIDHWQSFFWDGRAANAEQQALMPIENPLEMDLNPDLAVERVNLANDYRYFIQGAFQTETLNKQQMAQAIVAFERTFEAPNSLFTQFINKVQNNPKEAIKLLTKQQIEGLHIFRTKAKCMTCHEGALLSDNEFHITGLHFYGRSLQDLGRFDATADPQDKGKFRTPSLLGLEQSKPWMHNGLFSNFGGIVNFYNAGGARPKPRDEYKNDPHFPETTELLHKLELSRAERSALISFLEML